MQNERKKKGERKKVSTEEKTHIHCSFMVVNNQMSYHCLLFLLKGPT